MTNAKTANRLLGKYGIYVFIILACIVVYFFASLYFQQIVLGVIIIMILGISWDVLARTGQASFGQSTYFGIGVYSVAILAPITGVVAAWIISIILTMGIAALFGMLLSKLKGRYFAVSTLALSMAMQVIVLVLPFTSGASGISTTMLFRSNRGAQVILATVLLLVAVFISEQLLRPRPRTAAFLIRSNAYLAESSGIPVFRRKVMTFSISGGLACLAGAIYSSIYGYVLPEDVFNVKYNVMAIAVSILGGVDSSAGPLLGAILVRGIEEATKRTIGSTGYQLFVGLLIIVCVVTMPNGIVGVIKKHLSRHRERGIKKSGEAV